MLGRCRQPGGERSDGGDCQGTERAGGFTLPSFRTFTVHKTKARTALNPRTGESVKVKAGKTVRFKASPVLKRAVCGVPRREAACLGDLGSSVSGVRSAHSFTLADFD